MAATQLDGDSDQDQDASLDSGGPPANRIKRHKQVSIISKDADQLLCGQFPGWNIIDDSGSGDCAFRAVARVLSIQQGKEFDH